MTELTLTADQAHQLLQAEFPLVVRNPAGQVVGLLSPAVSEMTTSRDAFTSEEIAEAERRARENPERRTSAEVFAHLDALARQQGP
jgi:hypothetical protein